MLTQAAFNAKATKKEIVVVSRKTVWNEQSAHELSCEMINDFQK